MVTLTGQPARAAVPLRHGVLPVAVRVSDISLVLREKEAENALV